MKTANFPLFFLVFVMPTAALAQFVGASGISFTPQSQLHSHLNAVSGSVLQLTNTASGYASNTAGLGFTVNTNDWSVKNYQAGALSFWTSNLERMTISTAGNVGIGDNTPVSLLTIGNGDLFQVNISGNLVRVNNVPYSWPAVQGLAGTYLKNDGAGNLTWVAQGASSMNFSQTTTLFGTATILKTVVVNTIAGSEVFIHGEFDFSKDGWTAWLALGIYRDGVEIHEVAVYAPSNADNSVHIQWVDAPPAGAHTYTLRWSTGMGGVSSLYGSGLRVILFN